MRGHGAIVVGESLQVAVGRSVYLEQNARMQYQAELLAGRTQGPITFMDDQEVAANVVWQDYGRFWNLVRSKMLKKLEAEKVEQMTQAS
jgi:ribulose-5-phosphate 4-epimerase/fuculose-1-phosphate aldolase